MVGKETAFAQAFFVEFFIFLREVEYEKFLFGSLFVAATLTSLQSVSTAFSVADAMEPNLIRYLRKGLK
jgi:hypothetical protein